MQKMEIGNATIWNADCLQVLADMPDNSIDLIATDPPYFRVKAEEWDRQWKDEAAFLSWIGELCGEWRRVLKPNGSLYVFASALMATKVEVKISEYFNVLNSIRWHKPEGWHNKAKKEELRSYLTPCEKVIFAEQYGCEYEDAAKALHKEVYAPLGRYIQQERELSGLTRNDVEVALGFVSGSDPTRGTALCYRWEEGSSLPTKETYERMREVLNAKGGDFLRREYEDLRREYEDLRREYEDLRRPFNLDKKKAATDNWDFPTVQGYEGKHPCEKPVSMMRHIIEVSSRPGALVLDCFNGSGATGEAAEETGRQFVGVEKDPHWFNYGCRRIETARAQQRLF